MANWKARRSVHRVSLDDITLIRFWRWCWPTSSASCPTFPSARTTCSTTTTTTRTKAATSWTRLNNPTNLKGNFSNEKVLLKKHHQTLLQVKCAHHSSENCVCAFHSAARGSNPEHLCFSTLFNCISHCIVKRTKINWHTLIFLKIEIAWTNYSYVSTL